MIHARKRPPQRLFRRGRLRVCGARSNTAAVDEAQYSASFVWIIAFEYCLFLEIFGVDRVRSTVHNWVHKADLQPESSRSPNHVAIDETVIQLDDEQYWLYAAVDPESNDLLHTQLEPTTNNALADRFFADLRDKHDIDDATVLVDGSASLQRACRKHDLDFRYERHGNRNSVERVFREIKRRTTSFSNCFSNAEAETADEWLRSFAFAWNQLI
ncbi:Transposase (or an inactivated derivative) [Halorubrum ezzemoulense]|uniref:Transposase (Or an inactivated derivative) n=1 Tax=Halorubrum ezzemoulense TaxID=337243 RepID=A0A238UV44_HALEZ|nr:Transposase (or an inactivated derivative) [Halorubrum ezzemoulense]